MPKLTIDERLDVLLHVKWTVKEFDCNLTREIVDLIDREADLLNRCALRALRTARSDILRAKNVRHGMRHPKPVRMTGALRQTCNIHPCTLTPESQVLCAQWSGREESRGATAACPKPLPTVYRNA